MNDIQTVQFDLLKQFIAVCTKFKLRYYLFGGTCLGAVRHQGFIPWDDDIDVAMPRPDFDKLMGLASKFKEPYFLQNIHTDRRYSYPYAKLRNSDTCFIETVFSHVQMNQGVFIDIFPLDGMSKKPGATHVNNIKPYWLWFQWYFSYINNSLHPIKFNKRILLNLLSNFFAILFWPFNINNSNSKSIEKSCKRIPFEKATLVGPYLTMYFNKEALPFAVFGDGVDAKFEGLDVKIPADYDQYLKKIYGNYMRLPDPSKQKGHHYTTNESVSQSYKEILNIK
jgi:lipopolysaccharide cholinephosphotransferase